MIAARSPKSPLPGFAYIYPEQQIRADHQAWLRLTGKLVGVDSVPACTYDYGDIAASIAGAAVAAGIAWLILKLYSVPYSTA